MARYFSFRWVRMAALGAALAMPMMPAQAQQVCGAHNDLVERLSAAFQERRVGYGVIGSEAMIEVFVSTGGTWTMLMTDAKGRSCIVASGDGWENTLAVIAAY